MTQAKSYRPTSKDEQAIAELQERHPNLNTLAAVIRYCIHVTNQTELADAAADAALPVITEQQMQEALDNHFRSNRS